jgi:geranylgeranylglycerol-phosphate geranylgeranyltransferase
LQVLDQVTLLVAAILVVVCYNAGANAINDYCDIEIDRINRPERPLTTGLVSSTFALWIAVLLFVIGSVIAFMLPVLATGIAVLLAMPLMIFYSFTFKGLPLVGNIIIAFILGLTFIFAGAVFSNISPLIIPSFLAFGLTLLRELVKDIADYEGDMEISLRTYPIKVGVERAVKQSIRLAVVIGISTLLPYFVGYYTLAYLILLILGVEIPLFIIVLSFVKNPTVNSARTGSSLLKFSTISGLLAVWAGSSAF